MSIMSISSNVSIPVAPGLHRKSNQTGDPAFIKYIDACECLSIYHMFKSQPVVLFTLNVGVHCVHSV